MWRYKGRKNRPKSVMNSPKIVLFHTHRIFISTEITNFTKNFKIVRL